MAANPMAVARARRVTQIRDDAEVMRKAARIADLMNCPAVSNSCHRLAQQLTADATKLSLDHVARDGYPRQAAFQGPTLTQVSSKENASR